MKFYPCIVVTKDELYQAGVPEIFFNNGRITDRNTAEAIEDYCGRPVVSIRESTRNENELLVLIADGFIQRNRLSQKRTVVIIGNYETLQVVLTDIFDERCDEDPYEVFESYAYQTDINIQLDLQIWVKENFRR
jgi:hypothetical protein